MGKQDKDDWRGEHIIRMARDPKAGMGFNMKSNFTNSRRSEKIARRNRVSILFDEGKTVSQMQLELGVSRTTIFHDMKALGLSRKKES